MATLFPHGYNPSKTLSLWFAIQRPDPILRIMWLLYCEHVDSSPEVLATLTTDVGRILSKLHQVQPTGNINFLSGIRIAHLALKHRQGKNHKMRIIIFIGSPIDGDEKEIVKLAKRLKKEKVNVDIVNFGEDALNTDKLTAFVNTINGKEGSGSHLVTVPPGPSLSEALISSPVIRGEDGSGAIGIASGFEFGVDPNEDPELALALRVSMEEQRQRQEEDARRAAAQSVAESAPQTSTGDESGSAEEALLEKALAMSLEADKLKDEAAANANIKPTPNFASMTEEEQIAYAMQMSLQQSHEGSSKASQSPTPMETDEGKEEDYTEVMNDPEFLQSVLENLPGVDPQSEAVRQAMGSLTQTDKTKKDGEKK